MSAETALLGTLTIPGRPEFAQAARRFVARTLRSGHPYADTAVLLTSELVGNSLQYSDSRFPGGVITVTLMAIPGGLRTEVADRGGHTVPTLWQGRHPGGPLEAGEAGEAGAAAATLELAEGGRGLQLVDLLSARWSFSREPGRMVTWFELQNGLQNGLPAD